MTVRWGMLSTAAIGRVVAGAIRGSKQAEFVAVADRDAASRLIEGGATAAFGRADAVDQAAAIEAVRAAAATGATVTLAVPTGDGPVGSWVELGR